MPHALEIERLRTGYDEIEVLHGIDLQAPRGAIVALLGPSGAGKTTTMRAVAGQLPVWRGAIRLDGEEISDLSPDEIARRGLVHMPERGATFTTLTVEDNLRLGHAAARDEPPPFDEARDAITDVFPHLADLLGREVGTLSGGEQQMVALARVFLADPDVLLLDELSMGLAPKIVADLYEPVARLRERGTTIVLVEQQLQHALELADLCYVLVSGRIKMVAEPSELRGGGAAIAGYFGAGTGE